MLTGKTPMLVAVGWTVIAVSTYIVPMVVLAAHPWKKATMNPLLLLVGTVTGNKSFSASSDVGTHRIKCLAYPRKYVNGSTRTLLFELTTSAAVSFSTFGSYYPASFFSNVELGGS